MIFGDRNISNVYLYNSCLQKTSDEPFIMLFTELTLPTETKVKMLILQIETQCVYVCVCVCVLIYTFVILTFSLR